MEKQEIRSPNQCLNCAATLDAQAQFCSNCGQKRTTGRIRFRQLLSDFVDNFFNLDSRIFLTLRQLPIPGFLTQEYFKGRHRMYLNPLRLFLLATLIMVAVVSWKIGDSINQGMVFTERMIEQKNKRDMALDIDSLQMLYPNRQTPDSFSLALDTLVGKVLGFNARRKGADSIDLDKFMSLADEDFPPIFIEDALKMPVEKLMEKYAIDGVWRRWLFGQKVKMIRDSKSFLHYLVGRISWLVLILIPLFALSLKLFYIRRPFYYVEHFIFSIHIHSFIFLLIALQLLLSGVLPIWTIAITSSFSALYLLLGMKRFYQQSWWKTLLKFILLIFVVYWLLISLAMSLAVILGIIFF